MVAHVTQARVLRFGKAFNQMAVLWHMNLSCPEIHLDIRIKNPDGGVRIYGDFLQLIARVSRNILRQKFYFVIMDKVW